MSHTPGPGWTSSSPTKTTGTCRSAGADTPPGQITRNTPRKTGGQPGTESRTGASTQATQQPQPGATHTLTAWHRKAKGEYRFADSFLPTLARDGLVRSSLARIATSAGLEDITFHTLRPLSGQLAERRW